MLVQKRNTYRFTFIKQGLETSKALALNHYEINLIFRELSKFYFIEKWYRWAHPDCNLRFHP